MKTQLQTVLAVCLMALCWMPINAQKSVMRGDVDNDSKVTITDATELIDYLLGGDGSALNLEAADFDVDGSVNIADAVALIDFLLTGEMPDVYEPVIETFTVGTATFDMLLVEGGTFMMGGRVDMDPYVKPWELPVHQVTLSDYYICTTEVTQALWRAVMGTSQNPSWFTSANGYTNDFKRPVESVTFANCQSFITKLNQKTGMTFRLPTEAEWEFAARGGKWSRGYMYIGGDDVYEVAWQSDNSNGTVYPVGTKAPNELGLYDMGGNVEEWCSDWYGLYSESPQVNPTGVSSSSTNSRVMRGGSWDQSYRMCRPTQRHDANVAFKSAHSGMRLAMSK